MERAHLENILTAILRDGSSGLRLRRLAGAIVLLAGVLALLIHGTGILL